VVDVSTLPAVSTATHIEVVGQEIPVSALQPASTCATDQAAAWVVAAVELATSPSPSTAIQVSRDGQATALIWGLRKSPALNDHVLGPGCAGAVLA
jgi:hypothetical protein